MLKCCWQKEQCRLISILCNVLCAVKWCVLHRQEQLAGSRIWLCLTGLLWFLKRCCAASHLMPSTAAVCVTLMLTCTLLLSVLVPSCISWRRSRQSWQEITELCRHCLVTAFSCTSFGYYAPAPYGGGGIKRSSASVVRLSVGCRVHRL